jgi:hypothetical protein
MVQTQNYPAQSARWDGLTIHLSSPGIVIYALQYYVISTYFKICPYCTWLLCVPNWSFTKLFWPATLGRNFTCKIVGCSQNWGKRLIFCALTVAMFVFPWTRILLWDLVTNGSLNRLLRSREQPIFVSSNSPDRKSESHDIHGDYPDGLPMKIPCLMS